MLQFNQQWVSEFEQVFWNPVNILLQKEDMSDKKWTSGSGTKYRVKIKLSEIKISHNLSVFISICLPHEIHFHNWIEFKFSALEKPLTLQLHPDRPMIIPRKFNLKSWLFTLIFLSYHLNPLIDFRNFHNYWKFHCQKTHIRNVSHLLTLSRHIRNSFLNARVITPVPRREQRKELLWLNCMLPSSHSRLSVFYFPFNCLLNGS